jgi:hypothetical protein
VKSLPEILRDAVVLLDGGREYVVIARGDHAPIDIRSHAWQIRLRVDRELSFYRCETRGWLGEEWSSWSNRCGRFSSAAFDLDDVLATDWRISS